jgi:transcriptional regulator with XRE-family HTH domain
MSTFGERLKHLREARGWTQQELAERSQVPYITIYRCERGQHQEPRVGVAAKLARALGVSLDVLANTYGDVLRDGESELLAAVADERTGHPATAERMPGRTHV